MELRCVACGGTYNAEPGPRLCGPCWLERGRPDIWPIPQAALVAGMTDRDDWPVHQPDAPEAPIPGRHWYSGCDPDLPRVNPETGVCEGCGGAGCGVCGREDCPDHSTVKEEAA